MTTNEVIVGENQQVFFPSENEDNYFLRERIYAQRDAESRKDSSQCINTWGIILGGNTTLQLQPRLNLVFRSEQEFGRGLFCLRGR